MLKIQTISHPLLILLFVGLSNNLIAQKVTLEPGNIVAVDGEPICQYLADTIPPYYAIYLYNMNQKGELIVYSRDKAFKSVKSVLKKTFSDPEYTSRPAVKIINSGDPWPLHLRGVQNKVLLDDASGSADSKIDPIIHRGELSVLKRKLRFSGGMILIGESIKLIGGLMVEENPTIDALSTYKTLDRIGSLLIIIGGGALIVN